MQKAFAIVGVGFVVLLGGWYMLAGQKDAATIVEDTTMNNDSEMVQGTNDSMSSEGGSASGGMAQGMSANSQGSYEAYALEKLAKADTGDVVLFFRASWCPTCKALDADVRAKLSQIPAGLTILDVDYDNSQSLKQKYGVTYQHTFVQVDAQGNQKKKWSGSPTLAALLGQIQ